MKTFKIASLNLYQFLQAGFYWHKKSKKNRYSADEWLSKKVWLKMLLEKKQVDIICFQEVFSPDALEQLCKEVGLRYFIFAQEAKKSQEEKLVFTNSSVAFASRFPLHNAKVLLMHPFAQNVGVEASLQRFPLSVEVEVEKKWFHFVGVHLKSKRHSSKLNSLLPAKEQEGATEQDVIKTARYFPFAQTQSSLQRLLEVNSLYAHLFELLKEEKNLVVLGDFNDVLDSDTLRLLCNAKLLEDLSFKQQRIAKRFRLYNSASFFEKETVPTHFASHKNTIDFILLSYACKNPEEIKLLDYSVESDFRERKKKLTSDHALICTELGLIKKEKNPFL